MPDPTPLLARCRVLLTDDDALIRAVYGDVLRDHAAELLLAADGLHCVALARQSRLDLVLLDLHMPCQDGWETILELRRHPETADVPVVALSGDATPGTRARALAHGFDAFLVKPATLAEFIPAVQLAAASARAAHGLS